MAILRVKVDYPTIQAAVDAASPGDYILVESGVYSEQITVSTNYLQIIGENGTILDGQSQLETAFVLTKVNGAKITNFKIDHYRFDAIAIMNGSYNRIVRNGIWDSGDTGINVYQSPNTQINGNEIYKIRNYGIFSDQSPDMQISDNTLLGCGRAGIMIASEYAAGRISGNRILKNKQHGIVNYARGSQISGNGICGNNVGLYAQSLSLLENNAIKYNREDGVQIFGDTCTIRENTAALNGGYGIFVGFTGGYHSIYNNRAIKNKGHGFLIGSRRNIVIGNTAEDNDVDLVLTRPDNLVQGNCCKTSNPPGSCEQCPIDEEEMARYDFEYEKELLQENLEVQKKKLDALKTSNGIPFLAEQQAVLVAEMEMLFQEWQSEEYLVALAEEYSAQNG